MVDLFNLCTYLKELLQVDLFQDYGPNGLQVEGKKEVKKGAFAVSASFYAIDQAAKKGADFLFTHHGIFWTKDPLPLIGTKKDKIARLVEKEISLLSYHLPLDAHSTLGNNWKAAHDLGWKQLQPFASIGVKGVFEEIPVAKFQKELERYFDHPAHVALGGKKKVRSCALISGGAHREIVQAIGQVDCFVTGSFDEPTWHQAHEGKVNFFALGHAATEKIGPKAMMDHLTGKFGIKSFFIEENNPF